MQNFFDFDPVDVEHEIQIRQDESEIVLRPYQVKAVDAAFKRWDAGDTATLVVMATGLGKSVVFSEVMRRWTERAA